MDSRVLSFAETRILQEYVMMDQLRQIKDLEAKVKRQKEEIKRLQDIICCAGRYLTDEVYEIPYCVTEEFMRIREK